MVITVGGGEPGNCVKVAVGLACASIAIPLLSIAVAAVLSGWFNLYENALSDLGHATRSHVAWIFNLGLSAGGVLVVCVAVLYVLGVEKLVGVLLSLTGYSLVLVAVFDEVYGALHFIVSVLFFTLLLVVVLVYSARSRRRGLLLAALIVVALNVVVWSLHFTTRVFRGAAIPELISIFTAIPFYLDATRRYSRLACQKRG